MGCYSTHAQIGLDGGCCLEDRPRMRRAKLTVEGFHKASKRKYRSNLPRLTLVIGLRESRAPQLNAETHSDGRASNFSATQFKNVHSVHIKALQYFPARYRVIRGCHQLKIRRTTWRDDRALHSDRQLSSCFGSYSGRRTGTGRGTRRAHTSTLTV